MNSNPSLTNRVTESISFFHLSLKRKIEIFSNYFKESEILTSTDLRFTLFASEQVCLPVSQMLAILIRDKEFYDRNGNSERNSI